MRPDTRGVIYQTGGPNKGAWWPVLCEFQPLAPLKERLHEMLERKAKASRPYEDLKITFTPQQMWFDDLVEDEPLKHHELLQILEEKVKVELIPDLSYEAWNSQLFREAKPNVFRTSPYVATDVRLLL